MTILADRQDLAITLFEQQDLIEVVSNDVWRVFRICYDGGMDSQSDRRLASAPRRIEFSASRMFKFDACHKLTVEFQ
jgi:hypothetical protein